MIHLDYIPGDLVMTNGVPLGTAQNVVYRVTSSDPSKTLELDDGTVLKGVVCLENIEGAEFGEKGYLLGDCCAWVKDIVPIPLTSEILEKNGWRTQNRWYYYLDVAEGFISYIGIDFKHKSNKGHLYVEVDGNNMVEIQYCHELQHFLFGLGINHEMEV